LGGVPAALLQPCCDVNHGNQKDLRLSILYIVEIVIIYIVVYLFILMANKFDFLAKGVIPCVFFSALVWAKLRGKKVTRQ